MVAGAPPGLRSGTRPRRASLPRELARRGDLGAHSSHRRRGCCCIATLAAILTQPLSLPPAPAAPAKEAPAPAPPPSGRLGDRLPPPGRARLVPRPLFLGCPAPVPSRLPAARLRRSPQAETGRGSAVPGLTQCAAVAHLSRGAPREPADSRALRAFPRTWGMEGRKAMLGSRGSSAARRAGGLRGPRLRGGEPIPTCWEPEECAWTDPRYFPGPRL